MSENLRASLPPASLPKQNPIPANMPARMLWNTLVANMFHILRARPPHNCYKQRGGYNKTMHMFADGMRAPTVWNILVTIVFHYVNSPAPPERGCGTLRSTDCSTTPCIATGVPIYVYVYIYIYFIYIHIYIYICIYIYIYTHIILQLRPSLLNKQIWCSVGICNHES